MLTIRFFRVGKINQPSFKIVVTDKRNPTRSGRFVEQVGFYNPVTKEKVLDKERLQYWVSKGAQPSPTVYNLLVKEGILEGKKVAVHKKSKKTAAPASTEASAGKPTASTAPIAPAPAAVPVAEKKEEPTTPEGPVA